MITYQPGCQGNPLRTLVIATCTKDISWTFACGTCPDDGEGEGEGGGEGAGGGGSALVQSGGAWKFVRGANPGAPLASDMD